MNYIIDADSIEGDAWELIIRLPDWEEYDSEEEAKRISENRMVSALLTADAIFVFYGQELLKILPEKDLGHLFHRMIWTA